MKVSWKKGLIIILTAAIIYAIGRLTEGPKGDDIRPLVLVSVVFMLIGVVWFLMALLSEIADYVREKIHDRKTPGLYQHVKETAIEFFPAYRVILTNEGVYDKKKNRLYTYDTIVSIYRCNMLDGEYKVYDVWIQIDFDNGECERIAVCDVRSKRNMKELENIVETARIEINRKREREMNYVS